LGIVAGLVIVALAFNFMNGFHDAANGISTVVSTRVLKPYQAVVIAALMNFIAVFIFHLSVAATVGKGIIDTGIVDHHVVLGALRRAASIASSAGCSSSPPRSTASVTAATTRRRRSASSGCCSSRAATPRRRVQCRRGS